MRNIFAVVFLEPAVKNSRSKCVVNFCFCVTIFCLTLIFVCTIICSKFAESYSYIHSICVVLKVFLLSSTVSLQQLANGLITRAGCVIQMCVYSFPYRVVLLSLPISPRPNVGCVLVCWSVIGVLLICRASGELDRHTGDSPGGYGVPAEVSGGHDGGAAQRRGAICSRCQENSGHGERQRYNSVITDVDLWKYCT